MNITAIRSDRIYWKMMTAAPDELMTLLKLALE